MSRTFTETEVRDAVMSYHNGCSEGKLDFLRSMGIAVNHDLDGSYTATISVSFDLNGMEYNEGRGYEPLDDIDLDDIADAFIDAVQSYGCVQGVEIGSVDNEGCS